VNDHCRPSPLYPRYLAAAVVGAVLVALYLADPAASTSRPCQIGHGAVRGGRAGSFPCACTSSAHAIVAFRGGDHEVRPPGLPDAGSPALTPIQYWSIVLADPVPHHRRPATAWWRVLINHLRASVKGVQSLVSFAGPALNLVLSLLMRRGSRDRADALRPAGRADLPRLPPKVFTFC